MNPPAQSRHLPLPPNRWPSSLAVNNHLAYSALSFAIDWILAPLNGNCAVDGPLPPFTTSFLESSFEEMQVATLQQEISVKNRSTIFDAGRI